jgi:hypothetical protein
MFELRYSIYGRTEFESSEGARREDCGAVLVRAPVCAYRQQAKWDGKEDVAEAGSWVCEAAK